jgi:hypothetical protein
MVIEFDASLNGGEILWFEKSPDGSERCLGTAAVVHNCSVGSRRREKIDRKFDLC